MSSTSPGWSSEISSPKRTAEARSAFASASSPWTIRVTSRASRFCAARSWGAVASVSSSSAISSARAR